MSFLSPIGLSYFRILLQQTSVAYKTLCWVGRTGAFARLPVSATFIHAVVAHALSALTPSHSLARAFRDRFLVLRVPLPARLVLCGAPAPYPLLAIGQLASWDEDDSTYASSSNESAPRSYVTAISEVIETPAETCDGHAKNNMGEARLDSESVSRGDSEESVQYRVCLALVWGQTRSLFRGPLKRVCDVIKCSERSSPP